ncbi:esterase family protein [Aurantibacter crassamenti]|uniref:alpha/beta hydrolase n=1 Tax=Aurantibacter crassamenti TaxID=1837375 RepID=UPI00193A0089|nr:alpha/beta hydrolase family protein [Aurantibacter crassamenti]MBM1106240.1 esterase family protein [Aurantibacter crassamenti]
MNNLKVTVAYLFISALCITTARAQIDTLMVFSKAMNKTIPNLVISPDNYSKEKAEKPVLYLLHGASGNYTDWFAKVPEIQAYANEYDMIIVCPDGDVTSWYFDSPIDSKIQYETYVSKELVESVDKKYNTIADKKGRAITGLSMGGHGAFYLAFKHQDVWGSAGSMSGGVDIRPFPNNWDIAKRLGTYAEHKEVWEENTVINMVYLLNGDLNIIFDCGYDDFFYHVNKNLHEKLVERNIAHDYIERPGSHNWEYWANAIKYHFVYFNDHFDRD